MPKTIVGIMGPGDGATAIEMETAYALGQQIAHQGWVVLTGGRNVGVMDAASRGAKSAGGLTIGILPTANASQQSSAIDIAILSDLGNARNNLNVLSSHVVVACGLGVGTTSEIALAIKAHRPVVMLQSSANSYRFFQRLTSQTIGWATTVDQAVEQIRARLYEPS
ncbi:hypothetical protein XM38_043030 [Halomicronema hongdechloris C2206]|uniref:TIGR00725 family protein n=1 Tax=Halomicronema hongdechloris C2206 TaxID=1641165 RepID=A0A1Z3HSR3_9CYAN|nr:LOG family protein [Halomicronema hongdechloris]ASC73339.1 hypothetical protein XM38_043030 [Halomicronema hongdechloris C2206]